MGSKEDAYKAGYERGQQGKDDADSVGDVLGDIVTLDGSRDDEDKAAQQKGWQDGTRDRLREEHKK
jgi:hypothetical protein